MSCNRLEVSRGNLPPQTDVPPHASPTLLEWMGDQFERLGDIYRTLIDGAAVYVIRNPAHAEHVLRSNWQNYVKGRNVKRIRLLLGNGLMTSEGEFWKNQRRMMQPAFHQTVISNLTDAIARANARLVEDWERAALQGESVNVTSDLSRMVLEITLTAIFSEDYERVRPHFDLLAADEARDLRFAEEFRTSGRVISEIATRRRESGTRSPDLLGLVLGARDAKTGQEMSERQLVSEIKTLIVASHETTASTLNWMWYLLSQNPVAETRLRSELAGLPPDWSPGLDELCKYSYARRIIDEAMRLYPAGWLITRQAIEDDRLGDYFLPARTEVYIPIYFIHRHPDLWQQPETFNPDRFEASDGPARHRLTMLPFSAGPRNCIGETFARVEMQIHLMMAAQRLRLRYAAAVPPEFDVGINLRSKEAFHMMPQIAN